MNEGRIGHCLRAEYIQGLNFFSNSSHQESTGPEKFSTGPVYRNGGNKIC